MNQNHYNLSKTKLGMAKYLASVEISIISQNNPYLPVQKFQNSPFLIPPEGDIQIPKPEIETNFLAKPNYQFGENPDNHDALSWSTVGGSNNPSNQNSRKGSMVTPMGPVKYNQVPRKDSTSTTSTTESNKINRNRLGSMEESIRFKNFFVSPTKDVTQRERSKSIEIENMRLDLEKKYSKIIFTVSRKIPMCEESYVYSILLFKKVL